MSRTNGRRILGSARRLPATGKLDSNQPQRLRSFTHPLLVSGIITDHSNIVRRFEAVVEVERFHITAAAFGRGESSSKEKESLPVHCRSLLRVRRRGHKREENGKMRPIHPHIHASIHPSIVSWMRCTIRDPLWTSRLQAAGSVLPPHLPTVGGGGKCTPTAVPSVSRKRKKKKMMMMKKMATKRTLVPAQGYRPH